MIFGIAFSPRWLHLPRAFIPALLTVALLIVQILPWSRTPDAMMPSLALMSLFFWSLRAPAFCPPLFACAIGVISDLTELTPLGSQALLFLILSIGLHRRARWGGLPFFHLWVLFALICLAYNFALFVIESAIGGHFMPLGQAIARTTIAAALYPLLARAILIPAERLAKDSNG